MANRILTTHVGSLPRPEKFLEVAQKRTLGEKFDEAAYEHGLKDGVAEVVGKQKQAGVDLINDGELAHTMGWAYDYGAWWSYIIPRLGGVEVTNTGLWFTKLSAHTQTPMAPKDFVEMLRSAIKEDEWMLYLHGAIMGLAGGFIHLLIFGT